IWIGCASTLVIRGMWSNYQKFNSTRTWAAVLHAAMRLYIGWHPGTLQIPICIALEYEVDLRVPMNLFTNLPHRISHHKQNVYVVVGILHLEIRSPASISNL